MLLIKLFGTRFDSYLERVLKNFNESIGPGYTFGTDIVTACYKARYTPVCRKNTHVSKNTTPLVKALNRGYSHPP